MPAFWTLPMFWYILAAATFLGVIYKLPFIGKLFSQITAPVGGKKYAWMILLLMGLWVGGVFTGLANWGIPPATVAGMGIVIDRIDYSTSSSNLSCTVGEETTRTDLAYMRCTDAQTEEEAAGKTGFENNVTLNVYRLDSSKAGSCLVTAKVTTWKSPSDTSDTKSYKIVEETTAGELEVYLREGGQTVTVSDPKEQNTIDFAEGESSASLAVGINIDEEAADELNQYDTRDIMLDFCGQKAYIIQYMEMDAAA